MRAVVVLALASVALGCAGPSEKPSRGAAGSSGASGSSGAAGSSAGTAGTLGAAGTTAAAGTSAAGTNASFDAAAPESDAPPASDGAPASDAHAASDGAPANAGCASALTCDDFESYAAPGKPGGPWKTSFIGGGTLSVDTTHAFSGRNAVHVTNPGAAATERAFMSLEGAPIFPLPHNTFFGRMMIYVVRVPSNTVHWTIIQGEGSKVPTNPSLTQAVYRYGGQINGNRLMSNYDTQPGRLSDCAQRSQVPVPMNKWSCVEWRFDGEAKELDFWLDGTIIPALSVRQKAVPAQGACQNPSYDGIWQPPTFEAIRLGSQHYQQGPGEAWIDDVAIDTKRIGCPPTP